MYLSQAELRFYLDRYLLHPSMQQTPMNQIVIAYFLYRFHLFQYHLPRLQCYFLLIFHQDQYFEQILNHLQLTVRYLLPITPSHYRYQYLHLDQEDLVHRYFLDLLRPMGQQGNHLHFYPNLLFQPLTLLLFQPQTRPSPGQNQYCCLGLHYYVLLILSLLGLNSGTTCKIQRSRKNNSKCLS